MTTSSNPAKIHWRWQQPDKWVAACGLELQRRRHGPVPLYKWRLTVWRSGAVWMARTAHANGRQISSNGQFKTQREAQEWAAREVGLADRQHVTGRRA